MIHIELTEEQADCLFDEVWGGATVVGGHAWGMLSRYERRMRRMCSEVKRQLERQDVKGVIAQQWSSRFE